MMTEQEIKIRERMDLAIKEDRERFFKIADTLYFQSKYSEHLTEIEELKQWWRNITLLPDYPNITFPIPSIFPEWFPKISFATLFEKDVYIEEALKRLDAEEALKGLTLEEEN